jgi:multiple sugar transport system permease protein
MQLFFNKSKTESAAGPVMKSGEHQRKKILDAMTIIFLSFSSIAFGAPFLWMVSSSFKAKGEIFRFPPPLLPDKFLWTNYIEIFRALPFERFFMNSFTIALAVTLGVLFTSSLTGYAFARLHFPGRETLFLSYLGTMMIPGAITLIPSFILMKWFNWLDTYAALIIPGLFSAWGTFMMRQFMLGIPRELEDAALIDGCNHFSIYWLVIMPLSGPVSATLAIFTFLGTWNEFLWPMLMLKSVEKWTVPLGLASFQQRLASQTPWQLIMAATVLSVLPIILIFSLGQKYYVQGIVTSGIKGGGG